MNIYRTYDLPHPVSRVYACWVSADAVFPPVEKIRIDPRPGGIYRLTMPGDFTMTGTFSDVVPGERLVYSWQWDGHAEITNVTVQFEQRPDGTAIVLHHGGFLTQESRQRHLDGWDAYAGNLKKYLDAG